MKKIEIEKIWWAPENFYKSKILRLINQVQKEVLYKKTYQSALTILMFITEQACTLFLFQVELV